MDEKGEHCSTITDLESMNVSPLNNMVVREIDSHPNNGHTE